jgi:Ca-activated chloride channel homolog
MIVLDASSSMGVRTSRITRQQSALRALMRIVPPVSAVRPLGLLVYSGGITRCDDIRLSVVPALGTSAAILSAAADVTPSGATPLGNAVAAAANYFQARAEAGTLVVVTDGQENCGADICALADRLAATVPAVQIYVIGYGLLPSEGAAVRCLAERNGGRYTAVGTADQLTDALEQGLGCPAISRRDSGTMVATRTDR